MSASLKEKIKYGLPVLLTLLLGSVNLAMKQIFPFGEHTIDYYDMAQQIAAFYYHVYDMLHGEKAFFFDWYTALGVNMAMSTSGCSNLSLFNLFFLFVPRDLLLESLSIFNLLKMMCMTFTMYWYLHKSYRAPYFFEAVLSVGYGFCGFVLVLYITNQWLDIAVLFPLIMLSLQKLFRDGTMRWYILTLSLALISSYYLSFMILIFVFLMTGLWILAERLFEKKENRIQYSIVRLGLGTLAAVLVSSFILVPQLMQTLVSARFENENGGGLPGQYLSILKQVNGAYTTRWWTLLGLSFAAALVFYGLLRFRKEKKSVFLVVGSILLIVLELFFESINLIWHFGSYIQYPIRNGFMIYFVFAACACYYAQKLFAAGSFEGRPVSRRTGLLLAAGFAVTVLLIYAGTAWYASHQGLALRTVFHITAAVMGVSFLGYVFLLWMKDGRYRYGSACLLVFELLFYTFLMIGKPTFVTGYSEEPEQEGEYIRICNQLAEQFSLEPDVLARVKNPDESLNSNYGLVLRRPALSNWTHLISPQLQQGAGAWGYSFQFTRLLDAGGTVFSDALLGVTETISLAEQPPALYEQTDSAAVTVDHLTGEEAVYGLYRNRYTLPWGMTIPEAFAADMETADLVSLQNTFYQALAGTSGVGEIASFIKNGSVIKKTIVSSFQTDQTNRVRTEILRIKVKGETALYFSGCGGDREDRNTQIFVNGKAIPVPSIKETDNTLYPAHFNNNAVCLGVFKDEELSVEIRMDLTEGELFDTQISTLDLEKLSGLCAAYADEDTKVTAGKRTLEVNVSAEEDGERLLLPLAFDEGFHVSVNGKRVQAESFAGLFTVIPLTKGGNEVRMSYLPAGMLRGGIVTACILLFLLAAGLFHRFGTKRQKQVMLSAEKTAEACLKPLYMAGWAVVMLAMYLIPVAAGVVFILL
ncbi:MAG: YfhO family protein [Lachnospiraceae bacterium]